MLQVLGERSGAGLTLCVPSNPQLADSLQVAKVEIGSAAHKSGKIKVGSLMVRRGSMRAISTTKDNTGEHRYVEGMVFPTLAFPSDHGILSTSAQFLDVAAAAVDMADEP